MQSLFIFTLMIDFAKFILYPAGAYAFYLLIPLIILYLIKPKPRVEKIPSLMFFLKELQFQGLKITFFTTLLRNLLFLLQLLALIALAVSIVKPFVNVSESIAAEHTVLIIDVSASSQTLMPNGKTRFETEIDMAKRELGKRNTIIAAGRIPEIIIENAKADDTEAALTLLKAKDVPSHVYDAIVFGGDILKEQKGKVVVFSDFIDTNVDIDLTVAQKMLESYGIIVEFKSVATPAKNVGIIDLDIEEDKTTVVVKNFNDEEAKVPIKIGTLKDTLTIKPRSAEVFSFTTPKGTTKIELDIKDDLSVDNTAYISLPEDKKTQIAFITNDKSKYITTALGLMKDLEIDYHSPPKPITINHDIIIVNNVNRKLLLPGTIKQINDRVNDGASAIIMGQPDLFQIDWQGLLPVDFISLEERRAPVNPAEENSFTKEVAFGSTTKFFRAKLKPGATAIAMIEDSPAIALSKLGKGKVIYYGLFDEQSDFKGDLYYPIFWKRIIDFLTNKNTIQSLNYETGKVLTLPRKQVIKTPNGYKTDNSIILDYTGVYTLEDRKVAANLINEKESDVFKETKSSGKGLLESSGKESRLKPIPYDTEAIIVGAFIVLLELLYIKMRGDF